jgi:hypothetical protein
MWCHDRVTAASDASGPIPASLGPFHVRGRWQESEAGSVLAATGPDGTQVELVLLGPGPASDAASRDRFAAAVDSLVAQRSDAVLAADLRSPWPWVALPEGTPRDPAEGGGRLVSADLLDAAVPAGSSGATTRGPQFSPHWRGRRSYLAPVDYRPPVVQPPSPHRARRRRWWLVAALLVLLLLLLVWWLLSRPVQQEPDPSPVPVPTITQLPQPTPSPSSFLPSPAPGIPTFPASPEGSGGGPALPAGAHQG